MAIGTAAHTALILADRQYLFRRALALALAESGWAPITEIESADALTAQTTQGAAIVVVDEQFSDQPAAAFCAALLDRNPDLRIVVLTSSEREAAALQSELLRAHAAGCLSRELRPEGYRDALRQVALGRTLFPYSVLMAELPAEPAPLPAAAEQRLRELTDRELEILALIVQGHSNPEIGRRLLITTNTVMKHVGNLYDKLGVRSRQAATRLYKRARAYEAEDGLNGASPRA